MSLSLEKTVIRKNKYLRKNFKNLDNNCFYKSLLEKLFIFYQLQLNDVVAFAIIIDHK